MNYLAHAFLSPLDSKILIGNLAADTLVPKEIEKLDPLVRKGVRLHYLIDETTDKHPAHREASKILSDRKIRYSGAVVDIIFDHILASNWGKYTDMSFQELRDRVYKVIMEKTYLFPARFKKLAPWIVYEDWFSDYRTLDGLDRAIRKLSYKTRYPISEPDIHSIVVNNLERFEDCFSEVITELQAIKIYSGTFNSAD